MDGRARGEPMTCIRSIKHAIHCLGCGKAWVDEDEECTCTDPEMETWTVAELCADCGQPMDGHPGYQGWSTGCSWPCRGKPKDAVKTGDQ